MQIHCQVVINLLTATLQCTSSPVSVILMKHIKLSAVN